MSFLYNCWGSARDFSGLNITYHNVFEKLKLVMYTFVEQKIDNIWDPDVSYWPVHFRDSRYIRSPFYITSHTYIVEVWPSLMLVCRVPYPEPLVIYPWRPFQEGSFTVGQPKKVTAVTFFRCPTVSLARRSRSGIVGGASQETGKRTTPCVIVEGNH